MQHMCKCLQRNTQTWYQVHNEQREARFQRNSVPCKLSNPQELLVKSYP